MPPKRLFFVILRKRDKTKKEPKNTNNMTLFGSDWVKKRTTALHKNSRSFFYGAYPNVSEPTASFQSRRGMVSPSFDEVQTKR